MQSINRFVQLDSCGIMRYNDSAKNMIGDFADWQSVCFVKDKSFIKGYIMVKQALTIALKKAFVRVPLRNIQAISECLAFMRASVAK